MSWFSFSDKKQVQVATEAVAPPKANTPGTLWLETSSEEVYQQTLKNMIAEVKAIAGHDSTKKTTNAGIYAEVLLNKIQKLDRNRMTVEQKKVLAAVVFGSIPRAMAKLETTLADLDERSYAVEEFGDTLRNIMTKHVDTMPRKIPVPNTLAAVTDKTMVKAVETVGSKESDQKLTTVKELATEAYELATNIEDRFFAEQAANSYIPDSIRMLSGLIHAPEDIKVEANELFMRQLEIIESQLEAIVGRSANNSLAAMKAHTEFLESKKNGLELG